MKELSAREVALSQNNLQATNMFKYLLGVFTNQSKDEVTGVIMDKTDEYLNVHPDMLPTAAYSQTLIYEVSLHLMDKINSISIGRQSSYDQEGDSYPIRLSGDDILESEGFDKAKANLTDIDKLSHLMYEMFTAAHNSPMAIDRLFQLMVEIDVQPKQIAEGLPTDSFLQFSAGINSHTISADMMVKAMICYLLAVQVSADNEYAITAARVNKSCIDLVIVDSRAVDIVFTDKTGDDAEYYHVYFQGFPKSSNGESGFGTIDVKSHGIFDKYLLQVLLATRIDLSKVLIVNWLKIDNEKQYKQLNNL